MGQSNTGASPQEYNPQIKIGGSSEFQVKTAQYLDRLFETQAGQSWLKSVAPTGRQITIVPKDTAPSYLLDGGPTFTLGDGWAGDLLPDGRPNVGANSTVYLDYADSKILSGNPEIGSVELLGHELRHAENNALGRAITDSPTGGRVYEHHMQTWDFDRSLKNEIDPFLPPLPSRDTYLAANQITLPTGGGLVAESYDFSGTARNAFPGGGELASNVTPLGSKNSLFSGASRNAFPALALTLAMVAVAILIIVLMFGRNEDNGLSRDESAIKQLNLDVAAALKGRPKGVVVAPKSVSEVLAESLTEERPVSQASRADVFDSAQIAQPYVDRAAVHAVSDLTPDQNYQSMFRLSGESHLQHRTGAVSALVNQRNWLELAQEQNGRRSQGHAAAAAAANKTIRWFK